MTRRHPELKQKALYRDSQITKKIIRAWDVNKNASLALSIFLRDQNQLSDYRFWELMRSVWVIAGSIDTAPFFRRVMASERKHRHYFSTPEEILRLKKLPNKITVYRACNNSNDEGLSWTLSKEYAHEYKTIFNKEKILSKEVDKPQIFALIERNNEEEIIML